MFQLWFFLYKFGGTIGLFVLRLITVLDNLDCFLRGRENYAVNRRLRKGSFVTASLLSISSWIKRQIMFHGIAIVYSYGALNIGDDFMTGVVYGFVPCLVHFNRSPVSFGPHCFPSQHRSPVLVRLAPYAIYAQEALNMEVVHLFAGISPKYNRKGSSPCWFNRSYSFGLPQTLFFQVGLLLMQDALLLKWELLSPSNAKNTAMLSIGSNS
ncbi:hypothetical protein RJT34_29877 [Clitoria ternatea]|uniref:Uncharacterized protein n=1 Tax=Clitoria ternatea TaxID=43366 RepID=A0AAN9ETH8_CLITE